MSIICPVNINDTPSLACPLGKQYRVSLPICDIVPLLRDRPLVAHKSFGSGWCVSDYISGFAVSRGKTRKLAIINAQERLVKYGNAGFAAAIKYADNVMHITIDNQGSK